MADRETQSPDTGRLMERLVEMGATAEELQEAERTDSRGALALELALRGPGERVTFDEAARQAELEPEQAARLWRALGFPDPLAHAIRVSPRQVETLRLMSQMSRSLLGPETALRLARVIGGSMAQLAEAIVDSFRIRVEIPRRDHGEPYSEVVADYSRIASVVVPALTDLLGDVLIGHLVAVSRASWGLDEQRAAVTRDLVIGFADLVDYTHAARGFTPAELAEAIGRFEDRMATIVADHGGRVVKLIGDEVMFTVEDPGQAARLALELIAQSGGDPRLPAVRIGLAAGPVVSHHGDYYGDVVNLAARLVKAAEPDTAIVSQRVAEHADSKTLQELPLKGYDTPVQAWRLVLR